MHPREREQQATYRAYLFGTFRVLIDHEILGGRGNRCEKALLLLKWFLIHPGRPFSVDELVDLGWRNTPHKKAVGGVHVAIHLLRRMLEPELPPGTESSFIRRSGSTFYRFEPAKVWWTDIDEVVRLFDRGRAADREGNGRRASFFYHRVAARQPDRFLEGEQDQEDRLAAYRAQFRALSRQSLVRLIDLYQQRREIEQSLDYAYQMLMIDPYHEYAAAVVAESHLKRGGREYALCRLHSFLESAVTGRCQGRYGDIRALCDRVVQYASGRVPGG